MVQMNLILINGVKITHIYLGIPPGGFEPPSPDPKSCMIDRYTTGVNRGTDLTG
jgi:hypothetical protein